MLELRLYLGELDGDYVVVQISRDQWEKLMLAGKASIDDGGIRFVELILDYPKEGKGAL